MIGKQLAWAMGASCALLLFWFGAHIAKGQQPASPVLRGRVSDSAGRPVSGALITLKRAGTANLATMSAADGSYSFTTLNVGTDYELGATLNGMASAIVPLRVSGRGERVSLPLRLVAPIQFEDVTARAGIEFTLRNGGTGKSYQPEIMLGGVAAFDFDNDGCTDLFFVNGAAMPSLEKTGPEYHNRLYRNRCDGTFLDVTGKSGLEGTGYTIGVGAADYDNDGYADLFVTGVNRNTLYRNQSDGTFRDVTGPAGLIATDSKNGRMWGISAGWFDYDNDGYLDLFVANYVAWKPDADGSCTLGKASYYCHPRVYQGLPNQLFHNNRDGTFTNVSEASGIRASIGKAMGVSFGDFDGDGLTDIFVANDSVPNFLFRNLGGGRFKESALAAGVAFLANGNAVAGMGTDFRDYDDDGLDDIAMNAMYFDTFPLFRNRGKPGFFTDVTVGSGVALATRNLTGWGMGLYDFDNDGHKDLFYAASHFPGSEPFVHAPAASPNHVLRNNGGGFFEEVSHIAGPAFQEPALYHGAAFADFDNDGRVDVVVSAVNGPARLFRNVSPGPAHWIALRLTGTQGNRAGLGARVKLTLPTGAVRFNHATSSVGYASSSEPVVRFGLGPYEGALEILITWPGGKVEALRDVKADRVLDIKQP